MAVVSPLVAGRMKLPQSGASGSFTPLSLPSLVIWLDPSNAATVTTGTGRVSQINDLSGNGNHFLQGTGANQPHYPVTINSVAGLGFTAADPDELHCTNSVSYGPSLTIASVHISTDTFAAARGLLAVDNAGAVRVTQYRWDSNTAPSTIYFPSGTDVAGTGATSIATTAQTFISVLDDAAHTVTNYINGAVNGSASGVAALASGSLAASMGRATTGGTQWWNGVIGEFVVCNAALSAQNVGALQTYLKAKWGTP